MTRTILQYLSVGIGGMTGAALRYLISLWLGSGTSLFPWATFAVNMSGAFLLSFLLFLPVTQKKVSPIILPGITTGLLGAYTTFSTLTIEIVQLFDGHAWLASAYLLLSFFLGLVCSFAGYKFARNLPGKWSTPS